MDTCYIDITVEFLTVAFHNILYYSSIYPANVFETRRKYNIVVYRCIHPEINQYIDLCLKSIAECLKASQLSRVEFLVSNKDNESIIKFVFDFDRNYEFDETADAYLVQCEQNLRAFCLKLSTMNNKFQDLPEESSFTVNLHTTESTAVILASNPDLECFPLVEVDQRQEMNKIIPLKRSSLRGYNIDTYIELK